MIELQQDRMPAARRPEHGGRSPLPPTVRRLAGERALAQGTKGAAMKLFRVIFPVGDIDRATAFYRRVLEQPGRRVSPGRHYFDCEGVILACYDPRADGDGFAATPLPEPVYIAVDDLEATFERCLAAGALFSSDVIPEVGAIGEISVRPWGERSFYLTDPFRNPICFVSRESAFL
jgi:catechol 2,3-dioxygenase-like lactoylglutathione lyase family enzyme